MTTVGFQGEPGAFSEEAATAMLGDVRTRGYADFDALLAAVEERRVEYGLLPCENTIYGSIASSYDLLLERNGLHVVDETTHRIGQCLIGTAGSTLDGIRGVRSHPVALEQCKRFLTAHPQWHVAAAHDTAGSVRQIVEGGDPAKAAIGPALAAAKYGARVLAESIQDEPENVTRFFLLSLDAAPRRHLGRACLAFHLPHRAGALHAKLGKFAARRLNMRNLVVRPRRGHPFEYTFYVELEAEGARHSGVFAEDFGPNVRVLGRY